MDKKEFLNYLRGGNPVAGDPKLPKMMHELYKPDGI